MNHICAEHAQGLRITQEENDIFVEIYLGIFVELGTNLAHTMRTYMKKKAKNLYLSPEAIRMAEVIMARTLKDNLSSFVSDLIVQEYERRHGPILLDQTENISLEEKSDPQKPHKIHPRNPQNENKS